MMIGFIGTPSCGKSTTAFGLCYRLKKEGYPVEFVAEYARRRIIECRLEGISGNGGVEGQRLIYKTDSANTVFYRDHANAISIMDGSTINCFFYGFDPMDFDAEAAKYDLLFYIPTTDVPASVMDANRMQDRDAILKMATRWDDVVRPLMKKHAHIVELPGYPHQNEDAMVAQAFAVVSGLLSEKKHKVAA
jgi:hypothetical protein